MTMSATGKPTDSKCVGPRGLVATQLNKLNYSRLVTESPGCMETAGSTPSRQREGPGWKALESSKHFAEPTNLQETSCGPQYALLRISNVAHNGAITSLYGFAIWGPTLKAL